MNRFKTKEKIQSLLSKVEVIKKNQMETLELRKYND